MMHDPERKHPLHALRTHREERHLPHRSSCSSPGPYWLRCAGPGPRRCRWWPPPRACPRTYLGKEAAPAFPTGLDWINTGGKPVTIQELKGKVVLLDFWTYGCVNCFHVIPDLEKLEAKYPDSLVIIGVHSAKFATEGNTQHIAAIVQRYGLKHPVVNDHDMQIWNEYGATGWPTLTLIDPAGNVVGQVSGEGHYALLDRVVGTLSQEFAARHALNTKPMWFAGLAEKMPASAACSIPARCWRTPKAIASSSPTPTITASW